MKTLSLILSLIVFGMGLISIPMSVYLILTDGLKSVYIIPLLMVLPGFLLSIKLIIEE